MKSFLLLMGLLMTAPAGQVYLSFPVPGPDAPPYTDRFSVQTPGASLQLEESYQADPKGTPERDRMMHPVEKSKDSTEPISPSDQTGSHPGEVFSASHRTFLVLAGFSLLLLPFFRRKVTSVREYPSPRPIETGTTHETISHPKPPDEPGEKINPIDKNRSTDSPDPSGRSKGKTSEPPQGKETPWLMDTPEVLFRKIREKARKDGELDTGTLVTLLEKTRSPSLHVRALFLLGRYRDAEALPLILSALSNPHPKIRVAAAGALVRLNMRGIEERMIEMAEDRDPHLRATALRVLSRIGTSSSHELLAQSMWDFETEVRMAAANAIGRLRVIRAAPDLREALGDFEECVRKKAHWALKQLHGKHGTQSYPLDIPRQVLPR